MKPRQVIDELRRYGFSMTERAGKLVISPRADLTPAMLAAVVEHRDEILRLLPQVGTLLWDTPADAPFTPWPLRARPAVVVVPDFVAEAPPKIRTEPPAFCAMCHGTKFLTRKGKQVSEYVCIVCHPPAHSFEPAAVIDTTTRPASQETNTRSKEHERNAA